MMADDLTELRERTEFANVELHQLAAEINLFLEGAVQVEPRASKRAGEIDLFVRQLKPVPVPIKSKAGMIANELRSVLDGLACQLAIRNGEKTGDVYFPISKTHEVFQDDGMKKLKRLSATDQATIIGLRPYREANPLLFGLHEADRTRKHTRLAACATMQTHFEVLGGIALSPGVSLTNCEFNGHRIVDMRLATTDEIIAAGVGNEVALVTGLPTTIPVRVRGDVTYSEPADLRGAGVVSTLAEFQREVARILGLFAPQTP